eukprot:9676045-Alexandrium_andersonii.AAC.1
MKFAERTPRELRGPVLRSSLGPPLAGGLRNPFGRSGVLLGSIGTRARAMEYPLLRGPRGKNTVRS